MFNKVVSFRCKRCILPNNYPGIKFDDNGICNYCHNFDKKWNNFNYEKAGERLSALLDSIKKKKRRYDALVPFSGGTDSSYVLYLCVKKFKMNVLAFNYDNCWQSLEARKNIRNVVDKLEVDFVQFKHDSDLMRKLYKGFLLAGAEVCLPCEMGFLSCAYRFAEKENIPAIMFGHSEQTETLLPMEIHYVDARYFADALPSGVSRNQVKDFLFLNIIKMISLCFIKRIQYVQLPQYVEWDEDVIKEVLIRELDWQCPEKNIKHFDCLFSPLRSYIYYQKFNFDKNLPKISASIRNGKITREVGLSLLNLARENFDDQEFAKITEGVLKKLGLTLSQIDKIEQKCYRDFKTYAPLILYCRKILDLISRKTKVLPENIKEKLEL